ncbi:peptidase family C78-domain-containing protein [Lentinula lateritia]|uniref:Peptidase family C78-domain-containing protein n=1 Tax=Lentinula aff. lateritia TaxID=2804960 RepID=A0ACC1UG67_9AGAR|nr:peptidase family C78-domain-containing protein [Lentinula aff. lateritia]KAJ3857889.1 peptidase family C78-domain-containing protein [Lentinula lateritia]
MSLRCQLCWENIDDWSVSERQRHYDAHLEESEGNPSPQANSSSSTTSKNISSLLSKGRFKNPMTANLEKSQDVFWYPAMHTPPPKNFIPGLIPVLKKALLQSHAKGTTIRAVLCYEGAVYISRQMWDASWGCGYRNFLMSCSALMDQPYQPMYFPLLDKPISPGIRNLQAWIEEAWNSGFDVEGRVQLKRLVDTNKWIGTSDICAAFLSRGVPAELVDFEVKDPKKGLAPLTNWIVQYFNKYSKRNSGSTINTALLGASPVRCTPCMPLIVQDNKHSRLVIGYELTKTGTVSLLVFDPSKLPSKRLCSLALNTSTKSFSVRSRSQGSGNECRESISQTDDTNKSTKVNHANSDNNGSDAAWTDGDDNETEFVDECMRDTSGGIEIISEVTEKRTKNMNKVDKDISVDEPSYSDVLKHFRWDTRSLQRKHKYQILYFPLEEPLSKSEMKRRKILTSEQIT